MKRPFRRFRYTRRAPWDRPWKPRGPVLPGRMLNPRLQRELRRANHLMSTGDHVNAGHIFQSLAQGARDIDLIYPAPMLFMRAAQAFLLGESFDLSIENAQAALEMLAAQERWPALRHEGRRYIEALDAEGKNEQAQSMRAWLQSALNEKPVEETAVDENRINLPEKCPYCGASMSLEQISAAGGKAAECHYCGSVILPRPGE
jgi:DNA-directed RNA polymerase subunit RPC12/RpoP